MTTTSRFDAKPAETDDIPMHRQICETCKLEFVPVSDEPLCGDCVRELFEIDSQVSNAETVAHDKSSSIDA
jgi:hypothetical protein